eukprot:TRINITY_DN74156_c0_g1_i1.p1 TRINITY_DN74156_c0_g1~~TRINITY_DN74156_c0_g1_i1.p1  ORF type:complete len:501 (-),score=67.71 TRINITY_DN74156_c0_g1_i1:186-1583(-)
MVAKMTSVKEDGSMSKKGETELVVTSDPRIVGVNPAPFKDYEKATVALVKMGVIPGCASVMLRKGQIIHSGTWGQADIEAGTSFSFDTLCRMVCATKSYVAVAFMTLVEEGKASLDDPLDKYIPSFANVLVRGKGTDKLVKPKKPILLKHLLVHTSGIGYAGEVGEKIEDMEKDTASLQKIQNSIVNGSIKSVRAVADAIAKVPLSFQPGYKYQYSFSYDVLGRVVEVIMGKSLDKCLQERVFNPLGMKDTKWAASDAELGRLGAYYAGLTTCKNLYGNVKGLKSRGTLYRIDGRTAKESHWRKGQQATVLSGGGFLGYLSGGLLSTVRDTFKFVNMVFAYGKMDNGRQLLKKSTIVAMEKNRLNARTSGSDQVCYMGNRGLFRAGANEFGMGGAACTYWNIDRGDETAAIWFTQNCDMPDYSELKGIKAKDADMWNVQHRSVVQGSKRSLSAGMTSQAKRARKA